MFISFKSFIDRSPSLLIVERGASGVERVIFFAQHAALYNFAEQIFVFLAKNFQTPRH